MRRLLLVGILTLLAAGTARAQATGQVAGRVTTPDGMPLPGVAVAVPEIALGTLTDENGSYTIPGVPAGTHRVRATRIGYGEVSQTATVAAGQVATVDFEMSLQAVTLEGVVAVGYGTQERRDVTGAIASVAAEEIREVPTSNAIEAIKGRVAGAEIISGGYEPGEGMQIRIRGARSLSAGNDPLYVVDGIPLSGGVGDINPADIASIEILKDASATAIYGSRGANGVVMITTRRGRAGETRITYDAYAGVQNILNKVDLLSGPEFVDFKREAYIAAGQYECPTEEPCAEGDQAIFSEAELAAMNEGVWTDWQDEILRRGFQQSHQVNVSGGNEETRFSVSGNYFDHTGITLGQDFERVTAGLSLDHNADRFRVGASARFGNSTRNQGGNENVWEEALWYNPLGKARDDDGNVIFTPIPSEGLRVNPISQATNAISEQIRTRLLGSLYAEYDLADWATFRSQFGSDLLFSRSGTFRGSHTTQQRLGPAEASISRGQEFAHTLTNALQLDRDFGDAHHLEGTLVYEYQTDREEGNSGSAENLPYEHQHFYNLETGGVIGGVDSDLAEWSLQSYVGRIHYELLDRYLFTVTGRVDGSSRLAPGRKYEFFPSVALAWRLVDEPFMANQSFFSDLKVRASYGRTGNTSIAPYQTHGRLEGSEYMFGDEPVFGYRPGSLDNPELEWEKTDQYNLGLDFAVLDNRITGTLDAYRQHTFDLLLERSLPSTSGFTSVFENIGETRNTGVELALSTVNLDNWNGITWTTDFNIAANRNEIVSLYGGTEDDVGNNWFIGEPIDVYFDYEYGGIWQLDEAVEAARYNQIPGQIQVVDQNGDGQINADDRVLLGRHHNFPAWTGGVSNRIEWKALDLSIFATARMGYLVNSEFHGRYNSLFGRYNNLDVDYWTPTNPSNAAPRPDRRYEGPLYNSARLYRKADNIRIRNITLGYSLPSSLTGRWGAESTRIYIAAQEPFIFTDYVGFDPESGSGNAAPSYRTFLVGLNLGL